jgi:hypothetical protein
MAFLKSAFNAMSDDQKKKLGVSGTKINTDGEHLVTIVEAFEIENRFVMTFEDESGKKADVTWFLTQTAGKADGTMKSGPFTKNGMPYEPTSKDDIVDNPMAIGEIKNLFDLLYFGTGRDFGSIVTENSTITYAKAGTKDIEKYVDFIGKEVTIVTSYLIVADTTDKQKAWRNQKVNTRTFFTKDRLSMLELTNGITVPKAIEKAVKEASESAEIEYKSRDSVACRQELALVKGVSKDGAGDSGAVNASDENDPFEE